MAKKRTTAVEELTFDAFEDLLAELKKPERAHVRLVKVDDQGLVEPARRRGGAIVMQPRVRIVATALDDEALEILRWERKWDVGSGVVTIDAFTGQGSYDDPTGKKTREKVTAALEARSLSVSEGEWTAESAQAAL